MPNRDDWISQCAPALTARIRRDAVWVDRCGAFEAASRQTGISRGEATHTVMELLGGADEYFAMPTDDSAETTEAKDFVIKAGNWLSTHWGSGAKSDRSAVAERLAVLAATPSRVLSGVSGRIALERLGAVLGPAPGGESDAEELLKVIKQAVGWKGRSSKGAVALQRLVTADDVSDGMWSEIRAKLLEEADEQRGKACAPRGENRLGGRHAVRRRADYRHAVSDGEGSYLGIRGHARPRAAARFGSPYVDQTCRKLAPEIRGGRAKDRRSARRGAGLAGSVLRRTVGRRRSGSRLPDSPPGDRRLGGRGSFVVAG